MLDTLISNVYNENSTDFSVSSSNETNTPHVSENLHQAITWNIESDQELMLCSSEGHVIKFYPLHDGYKLWEKNHGEINYTKENLEKIRNDCEKINQSKESLENMQLSFNHFSTGIDEKISGSQKNIASNHSSDTNIDDTEDTSEASNSAKYLHTIVEKNKGSQEESSSECILAENTEECSKKEISDHEDLESISRQENVSEKSQNQEVVNVLGFENIESEQKNDEIAPDEMKEKRSIIRILFDLIKNGLHKIAHVLLCGCCCKPKSSEPTFTAYRPLCQI